MSMDIAQESIKTKPFGIIEFFLTSYIPSDLCSASLRISIMHTYLLLMCLMIVLLDNKYILFHSIIEKGEEHCGHLIEAHKECMRALGFKI